MRNLILATIFVSFSANAEWVPPPSTIAVENSALLTWVAPSTRIDGSPLDKSSIAGYDVAYGTVDLGSQPQLITGITTENTQVLNLLPGAYKFYVRVVDTDGLESEWSTPVYKTIPKTINPDSPSSVSVTINIKITTE